MTISTRQGDKGKSSVLEGKRLSKSSPIFNALGTLDETNSWLGMMEGLGKIQKDLMTVSSILAGAKLDFPARKTLDLEREIDRIEGKLPKISGFVIPRGKAAKWHFARALVRRAERAVVALSQVKGKIPNSILSYLNRLSDYFFIKARQAGRK